MNLCPPCGLVEAEPVLVDKLVTLCGTCEPVIEPTKLLPVRSYTVIERDCLEDYLMASINNKFCDDLKCECLNGSN